MGEHLLRKLGDVFAVTYVSENQDELIATESCDCIVGPNAVFQTSGNFLQQNVPCFVPHGVVDHLETVQVQQHQRDQPVTPFRIAERLVQAIIEQLPVRQAGQTVVIGQLMEFFLGLLALGNVIESDN